MRRVGRAVAVIWTAVSLSAASTVLDDWATGWTSSIADRTWVSGAVDSSSWEFRVARSALACVDVAMVVGSQTPLRFECTVGILDLVPFRVTAGFYAGRLSVKGSVHLGPALVALERDIARRGVARWMVAAAVAPRVAMAVEGALRAADPDVGLTLMAFSATPPLTACSITITARRLRLSTGVGW